MIKRLLLVIAFAASFSAFSQDLYLKVGRNYTKFEYSNSLGVKNTSLESDMGNAYQIGYSFPFKRLTRFSYDFALILNEFNALVGEPQSNIQWNTEYAGVQSTISFSFIKTNRFSLDVNTGFNISTIIYGKEQISGVSYDLKNIEGFKGVVLQPVFGLEANLYASKDAYLSLGYNYISSISTVAYPEVFSIKTNQIVLGVHFFVINGNKKIIKKSNK